MVDPQQIWSSPNLPTLPNVAVKLLEISHSVDSDIDDVVDLIRQDPAISAQILKASNSSFFGFRSQVTNLHRAVSLLGTTVVSSLSLSFTLHNGTLRDGPLSTEFERYWMQSAIQAVTAETLSQQESHGISSEFFSLGLLLDLGRLAMLHTIPDAYLPVLQQQVTEQRMLCDVEQELLGFDHVTVGMELMERWHLPKTLIEAARHQHATLESLESLEASASEFAIHTAVLASATAEYFCGPHKGIALEWLTEFTNCRLHWKSSRLNSFLEVIRERVEQVGDLLSINTSEIADPCELITEANLQLAQLTLREHVASTQAEAHRDIVLQENESLRAQTLHDATTGAYNRRFFDETLNNEINRCRRNAEAVGIAFIDIDHFKHLNDTYGHQFGDVVLQCVTETLKRTLRNADTVARFGGDELVVLINQPSEKGLMRVAERLKDAVALTKIQFGNMTVNVTVSIGTTFTIPGRGERDVASNLVNAADKAMYESKKKGRNQVSYYPLLSEADRQFARDVQQRRFSRWLVQHNHFDVNTMARVLLKTDNTWQPIGTIGSKLGLLTAKQIEETLRVHYESDERFGEVALRLEYLTKSELQFLLAIQQEQPQVVQSTLVDVGLLDDKRATALLNEYLKQLSRAQSISK